MTAVPAPGCPGETWRFFTQFDGTTPTPPTTSGPVGGRIAAATVNQWTGGFVATVRVAAGSSAINGWRVSIAMPTGATITSG